MVVAVILVRREEKEEERLREDQEGGIPAAGKEIKGDPRERKTERKRKIERKLEKKIETEKNAHQIADDTMTGTTPLPSALVQMTERRTSKGQNPVGSLKENEHLDKLTFVFYLYDMRLLLSYNSGCTV